jgi:hypothetical protein
VSRIIKRRTSATKMPRAGIHDPIPEFDAFDAYDILDAAVFSAPNGKILFIDFTAAFIAIALH